MGTTSALYSGTRWAAVTPHDTTNLPTGVRGIYVGQAGNIAAVGQDDVVVVLTAVPVGTLLPIQPKRINSTSTTAALLVAIY